MFSCSANGRSCFRLQRLLQKPKQLSAQRLWTQKSNTRSQREQPAKNNTAVKTVPTKAQEKTFPALLRGFHEQLILKGQKAALQRPPG